jgi:hypothetical protein
LIHYVEPETRDRSDQRAYRYWAFIKDPSRIPQVVFLTLTKFEKGSSGDRFTLSGPRG